jgi:tripartite-type tricarboxylate transporter receptor subunit TctC
MITLPQQAKENTMQTLRPKLAAALLAGGTIMALAATPSAAQEFPSKPIRYLIPYPSGSVDVVGRAVTSVMSKELGQPFVVENKGGGGGVPAVQDLKNSPADGHTLLQPDSSQYAILPAVQPNVPYDPLVDFAPIGMLYSNLMFFVVPSDARAQSMKDIVAEAKAKPGALRIGVTGVGGIMHLVAEAFASAAGIKFTVVPYRVSAESITSVINKDLDIAVSGGNSIMKGMVKAGKIRALATTGAARDTFLKDVPTVNESAGISGYSLQADIGIVTKGGTPRPIVEKLAKALAAVHRDAGFHDTLKKIEFMPVSTTPEEFGAKIRSDFEKYRAIARAANIKVE